MGLKRSTHLSIELGTGLSNPVGPCSDRLQTVDTLVFGRRGQGHLSCGQRFPGSALVILIDALARYGVVSGITNRYLVGPLDGPGGKPLK